MRSLTDSGMHQAVIHRDLGSAMIDFMEENRMLFQRKRTADERVQKKSEGLGAKMFPLLWIANLVFLIVKVACGLPVMVYALEILILISGSAVWLAEELRYGTLLVKEKDDMLTDLSNKARSEAFMTMFWIVIVGELLYVILVDEAYLAWGSTYLICWFPIALYITIVAISGGLLVFGSRKQEETAKKALAVRTFLGAVFFGVFVGWPYYFRDGMFHAKGLLAIPLLAAGWGIPFYLVFIGFMKLAEKRADKEVNEAEDADEE